MAEEEKYTPEEQAQIASILENMAQGTSESLFSPLAEQYQNDLIELEQGLDAPETQITPTTSTRLDTATEDKDEDVLSEIGKLAQATSTQDTPQTPEATGILADLEKLDAQTQAGPTTEPPATEATGILADLEKLYAQTQAGPTTEPPATEATGILADLEKLDAQTQAGPTTEPPATEATGILADLEKLDAQTQAVPTTETPPAAEATGILADLEKLDAQTRAGPTTEPPATEATGILADLEKLNAQRQAGPTTEPPPAAEATDILADLEKLDTQTQAVPTTETPPATEATDILADLEKLDTQTQAVPTTEPPATEATDILADLEKLDTQTQAVPTTETPPATEATDILADLEKLDAQTQAVPATETPQPTPPATEATDILADLEKFYTQKQAVPTTETPQDIVPATEATDILADLEKLDTQTQAVPTTEPPPATEATDILADLGKLDTQTQAVPTTEPPPATEATDILADLEKLDTQTQAVPTTEPPPATEATDILSDLEKLDTQTQAVPATETPQPTPPATEATDILADLEKLDTQTQAVPATETPQPTPPATEATDILTADTQVIPDQDTASADTSTLGLDRVDFLDEPSEAVAIEDSQTATSLGSEISLDSSDFTEIGEKSKLESAINKELSDEELANIRTALLEYPPYLRKLIIDIVVSDKFPVEKQQQLVGMLIERTEPKRIADFIETEFSHLGLEQAKYTKEGVKVIYTDELSPQLLARRRRVQRTLLSVAALGIFGFISVFGGYHLYHWFFVKDLYEKGLAELLKARQVISIAERTKHKEMAESYFQQAIKKDNNTYNLQYLNRYGIAYMKARFYEEAFIKLFGQSDPPYGSKRKDAAWNWPKRRVSLIRRIENMSWKQPLGESTYFTDQFNIQRKVVKAGAYMVSRLRDSEQMDPQTVINLGRFHSQIARDFTKANYKNDALAIAYYSLLLTLLNKPQHTEALAGIGNIYYNQDKPIQAANEYKKIIDYSPLDIKGNAGLLDAYVKMAKQTGDPRPAIAKHRELRNLGLEGQLPIFLLTKLAGLYTQLQPDDLLIKYQIDPTDSVSGLSLKDNVYHLLDLALAKEETRDNEKIIGSRYAEGFYQRGLFLAKQGENLQALRQFQNAYNYDPSHYLAINAMGEYYKNVLDFERAGTYFQEAIKAHRKFMVSAGIRLEDETLLAGDLGRIYYNLGSLLFLRYAGFPSENKLGFTDTRLYPFRARTTETNEIRNRREQLFLAKEYFDQALLANLEEKNYLAHLRYWSGWIEYMNGDFSAALEQWESSTFTQQNHDFSLLLGKANAYYYTNQLESALSHYLTMRTNLEKNKISILALYGIELKDKEQQLLLTAIYNNIGAIYEKEAQLLMQQNASESQLIREHKQKALLYYWKSVELARNTQLRHEIARTNVQLAFQTTTRREPLLDDWLPPTLSVSQLKKKF